MQHYLDLAKMIPVAFAALFPVINPIGTAIILLGLTGNLEKHQRRSVAASIAVNTLLLLTVVLIAGGYILSFFGLTIPIVQAAGGLILASMGWNMLKQDDKSASNTSDSVDDPSEKISDKLFYPFTFPITVGPGGVAVTLTLSAHSQHESLMDTVFHQAGVEIGIIAVCILVYFSFAESDLFARRLGPSGTKVLLRLMAFILVCLGAEIFWNGASTLLRGTFVR